MSGRVLLIAEPAASGFDGLEISSRTIAALDGSVAIAVARVGAGAPSSSSDGEAADSIAGQICVALAGDRVGAVKVGALSTARTVDRVAELLRELAADVPLLVDPAIRYRGPAEPPPDPSVVAALKRCLTLHATVLVSDPEEAEALTGMPVRDAEAMRMAAQMLLTLGPGSVFLKGGGPIGEIGDDLLATEDGCEVFASPAPPLVGVPEGIGHALSAAIAVGLAQGMPPVSAISRARRYVYGPLRPAVA